MLYSYRKELSYHPSYLTSFCDVSECAVKRPNLQWLWPVRKDSATYFVLIGRSRGKLGRFTAHLLPLSSDEVNSDEMRWDKWYERFFNEDAVGWWLLCPVTCLYVCLCCSHNSKTTWPNFTNFLCVLPVALARSSSRSIAMSYVLPVLRMTSQFHTLEPMGIIKHDVM